MGAYNPELDLRRILKGMDTLSGEATIKINSAPSEKGSTWKGKKCYPWEQILYFQSRPFFRRDFVCRKVNRKSQKLSPL